MSRKKPKPFTPGPLDGWTEEDCDMLAYVLYNMQVHSPCHSPALTRRYCAIDETARERLMFGDFDTGKTRQEYETP